MPPFGADIARSVADSVGAVGLDEEATAELGLHIELHLRGVIGLALKLARRARRQKLCLRDVCDALECLPTGTTGSRDRHQTPSAICLAQHCITAAAQTNGGGPMHRVAQLGAPRCLGSPPRDMQLRVEWLAVDGAVVASFNGLTDMERMQSEASLGSPCQWLGPPAKPSGAPLLLTDEHLALLHRITRVLDGGDDMCRWHAATIAMCKHEVCLPLLPFLAQFLVHKVPACISDASPAQLCMLLHALGAVALAPQATERYLHQCLPAAMLLCLSPDIGMGYRESEASPVIVAFADMLLPLLLRLLRGTAAPCPRYMWRFSESSMKHWSAIRLLLLSVVRSWASPLWGAGAWLISSSQLC